MSKIIFILTILFLSNETGQIRHKSSIKSTTQQIDCGIFYITENKDINNNYTIADLNDCLINRLYTNILYIENNLTNESFYSFDTRFGYKSNEILFNKYFNLNRQNGQINLKQNIDRETFCTEQLERESSSLYFRPGHKNFLNAKLIDFSDCDCKSLKCEMRLVFVAFSNRQSSKSSKLKKFSNANSPKYIYLTVIVEDSNDNKPKFLKNFIQFNLTESLNNKRNTQIDHVEFNFDSREIKCKISQFSKQQLSNISIDEEDIIDQQEQQEQQQQRQTLNPLSDNLIQLETAVDLDVGINSEIKYKLFLFKNTTQIDSVLNEKEKSKQLEMINNLIQNDYLDNCQNKFELIETDSNYKINEYSLGNKFDQPNVGYLFFKVNTFLDREVQENYHFILIASNEEESTLNDLNEENYVIIRLNINDLNDNQPMFNQKNYVYYLNETTEFSEYYSPIKYEDYYQELLRQTCNQLKTKLIVTAIDYDYGENGIVKYKIVQQIHRKSSQEKSKNTNNEENKAVFHIDENNGQVTLNACKNIDFELGLTRDKFIEITQYLDYESYSKHILVIEASDSNLYNPLQTLATLEINLLDLNDNSPMINSFYLSHSNYPNQDQESFYDNLSIRQLNESISNYTTEIIIDGLTELLKTSNSIGQLMIVDLDSLNENKKIDLNIWELDENRQKIVKDSKLTLKNTKTVEIGLKKRNKFLHKSKTLRNVEHDLESLISDKFYHTIEMYDIYLNFDLDAEKKQKHEFILEINDNGDLKSFKTSVQLIINVKDENDNLPIFEKKSYNFKSNDNNSCFGRVKAIDLDIDPDNSLITYEINKINYENHTNQTVTITSNNSDVKFYITNDTNQLCAINNDIEDNKYHLLVKAFNKNATRNKYLYSEVLVQVEINNNNNESTLPATRIIDNKKNPIFFKKKYTFYVTEHDANLVNSDLITFSNNKTNVINDEIQFIGNVNVLDSYCDGPLKLFKYYVIDNERNYLELNVDNQKNSWSNSELEENFKSDHHTPPSGTKSYYRTKLYKKSINQTNPKYRSLKMIENINDFIHVNSSNGNIYLLKKIDREEIIKIKFHLYVSDCDGNAVDNNNGNYSVPIVIEIVDINDSKPQCKGSPYLISTNENLNKFSKPLDIYSVMFNTKSMSHHGDLIQIYKFDCYDLDMNKNGELTFEIDKIIFKSLMSKKSQSSGNSFNSINTSFDEETLNEVTKIQKRSRSKDTDFLVNLFKDNLLDIDLFSLDRSKGILSLNLSEQFLSYFNNFDVDSNYHVQKLFKKSFFIVQIKVSDRGMIPLSSYYYFQIYFCINTKHNSYEKYLKHKTYYCDFDSEDDKLNNNNSNKVNQLKFKSLVNSLIENNHFGDIIINESKLVKQTFVYRRKNSIAISQTSTSTKQSAKKSSKSSTTSNQNFITTTITKNNNINSNTINKNFLIYMNTNNRKQTTSNSIRTTTSLSRLKISTSKNNENEDYDDYSNKSLNSKSIKTANILICYLISTFLFIFFSITL